jgi:hypothetical protein
VKKTETVLEKKKLVMVIITETSEVTSSKVHRREHALTARPANSTLVAEALIARSIRNVMAATPATTLAMTTTNSVKNPLRTPSAPMNIFIAAQTLPQ